MFYKKTRLPQKPVLLAHSSLLSPPAPFLLSTSCADKQQGTQEENRNIPKWRPGVRAHPITLQNTALASSVLLLSPSETLPPSPLVSAPLLVSLLNFKTTITKSCWRIILSDVLSWCETQTTSTLTCPHRPSPLASPPVFSYSKISCLCFFHHLRFSFIILPFFCPWSAPPFTAW